MTADRRSPLFHPNKTHRRRRCHIPTFGRFCPKMIRNYFLSDRKVMLSFIDTGKGLFTTLLDWLGPFKEWWGEGMREWGEGPGWWGEWWLVGWWGLLIISLVDDQKCKMVINIEFPPSFWLQYFTLFKGFKKIESNSVGLKENLSLERKCKIKENKIRT